MGNLRETDKFIVTDAKWDATIDDRVLGNITRPNGTTIVTDTVGLLNMYEYQTSYRGTMLGSGYLNNGNTWVTLTPYDSLNMIIINNNGLQQTVALESNFGIRPAINLKSEIKIVSGDGTEDNPYRLKGDNDSYLSGVKLNTRYSGEYISFGEDENNLYRIASHETEGLTKITSAEPLKSSGNFITCTFDSDGNVNYSSDTTIGTFLNGEYLTSYVGDNYRNMIEPSTTWYLGRVSDRASYRLAKYSSTTEFTSNQTTAQVGLLRLGELMSSQFERYVVKGESSITGLTTNYWTLTPYNTNSVHRVREHGYTDDFTIYTSINSVKPAMNLKSNVVITGGSGTKSDPFTIALQ